MPETPRKGGRPVADSPWKKAASPPPHKAPAEAEGAPRERKPVRPSGEMRLYGINACRAAFAKRPQDLRKVYLTEARVADLKPVLAWCVKHRLGYRVVEIADLDKLTGSRHHEGVCFEMIRQPPRALSELLAALPSALDPALLVWLDGVGNPHNLGALLRSAAHFGVNGVIVPTSSSLDLSGAAARVAEGGAEFVNLARVDDVRSAIDALRAAGFTMVATVPSGGSSLHATRLARRSVLVFGAEGEGMSRELIDASVQRLSIPGSGCVESLNIAASAAILMAEFWRQMH